MAPTPLDPGARAAHVSLVKGFGPPPESRRSKRLLAACTSCCVALAPALAKESEPPPQILEPSGSWHADFGDHSCILVREYGDSADKSTIWLRRTGPLSAFLVGLFRATPSSTPNGRVESLRLDEQSVWSKAYQFENPQKSGGTLTVFHSPDGDFIDGFTKHFNDGAPFKVHFRLGGKTLVLELKGLKNLKTILDKCEDDLMAGLGLDGPSLRTLSQKARGSAPPWSWINSADFPASLAREETSAYITLQWIIDENGKISECFSPEANNRPALIELSCGLLKKRLSYQPARDSNGVPVKSYIERTVFFLNRN